MKFNPIENNKTTKCFKIENINLYHYFSINDKNLMVEYYPFENNQFKINLDIYEVTKKKYLKYQ